MVKVGRSTTIAASIACLGMAAVPAAAADLPLPRAAVQLPFESGSVLNNSRRYGGYGYRRHRDNTGDVIAGVLAVGGIAALIAAATSDHKRNEPRRYPDTVRYTPPRDESSGIGRAVDMCTAELERNGDRVANVENAGRDASGWHVDGVRQGGDRFTCRIGNDGRIQGLDFDNRYQSSAASEDRQYADNVYSRLRQQQSGGSQDTFAASSQDSQNGAAPAYPGGPYPGEPGYDDYEAGRTSSDNY